jgi:hypothetical protein
MTAAEAIRDRATTQPQVIEGCVIDDRTGAQQGTIFCPVRERPPVKEHPDKTESLTLAALPSAVNSARSFVVSTLERWRAPLVIGDAVHLVEEMVTDAVKTTGVSATVKWQALAHLELLSVTLVGLRNSFGIEVWDAEPHLKSCPLLFEEFAAVK